MKNKNSLFLAALVFFFGFATDAKPKQYPTCSYIPSQKSPLDNYCPKLEGTYAKRCCPKKQPPPDLRCTYHEMDSANQDFVTNVCGNDCCQSRGVPCVKSIQNFTPEELAYHTGAGCCHGCPQKPGLSDGAPQAGYPMCTDVSPGSCEGKPDCSTVVCPTLPPQPTEPRAPRVSRPILLRHLFRLRHRFTLRKIRSHKRSKTCFQKI